MMFVCLIQAIVFAFSGLFDGGPLWRIVSLTFSLILFFFNLLVLTVVLYFGGLIIVGRRRALLSDAFIISLVGTVLSTLFLIFIPYALISLPLSLFVWLILIKRLFDIGWLRAIVVSILAVIIFLAITVVLALFFGILEAVFKLLPSPFALIP